MDRQTLTFDNLVLAPLAGLLLLAGGLLLAWVAAYPAYLVLTGVVPVWFLIVSAFPIVFAVGMWQGWM